MRSKHGVSKAQPWILMFPFSGLLVVFVIAPLVYAFYISLFIRPFGVLHFVGFRNYVIAFQDSEFWSSIVRILFYAVLQGFIMLSLALMLSLVLDSRYGRFKSLFQLLYFLPYGVPGVFASIMWGFLYSKSLNPLVGALNFDPLSSNFLLYSIINIATWEWTGYNMALYTASLTGISQELYEAARLDGCNEWQLAIYVKAALLRPTIIMTIVLSFIGAIQLFNEPFVLQTLTSVPENFTPNLDVYSMTFMLTNLPYGATLSVILAFVTITLTLTVYLGFKVIQKRRIRKKENQVFILQ